MEIVGSGPVLDAHHLAPSHGVREHRADAPRAVVVVDDMLGERRASTSGGGLHELPRQG